MKKLFSLLAVFGMMMTSLFFVGCSESASKNMVTFETPTGYVGFDVDVVKSTEDQQKGLGGVAHLPEKKGMLFWYEHEETRHFWMKDMQMGLDIIFIGADMKVKHILKELEPCTADLDRCPTYSSMQPSLYVVEIGPGLADKYNIKVGSQVEVSYQ